MKFGKKIISRKKFIYKILVFCSIATLAFLFSLQCSNHIWKTGSTGTDSSVFKYVARVILDGGMPYRDTFDHKGPLIYLINVIGLLLAEWRGIWVIELITIFSSFEIMYKISRLKCSRLASMGILLLSSSSLFKYFESGNLTEEFAIPFISASIYIFADYFLNDNISKLRLIICGFSLGAVCMLRVNMISIWIVMCIGVLINSISKHHLKELLFFLTFFMIGFSAIIVPIVIWLATNGSFSMFINDYIVFNKQYSSFATPAKAFASRGFAFMTFINETTVILALFLLVYETIKTRKLFDILYTLYFLTNIAFLSLSGFTFMHYGMIIVPSLIYPFAIFYNDCQNMKKSSIDILSLFFIYIIITLGIPNWFMATGSAFQEFSRKGEIQIAPNDLQIAKLVSDNSSPDDKILVCGNWNIIYNLSKRFASTKYSYQSPPLTIDEEKALEYYKEISENLPKVIVIKDGDFGYNKVIEIIKANNYIEAGRNNLGNTIVYVR